jgi:hypothetical protein
MSQTGKTDKTAASPHPSETQAALFCCILPQSEKDNSDTESMSTEKSSAISALHHQHTKPRMGMPCHEDHHSRQIVPENYHHHNNNLVNPQHLFNNKQELIPTGASLPSGDTALASSNSPIQPETNCFWPYPTFFDFLDAVLLLSCFRGVPVTDVQKSQYSISKRRQKVTIKVEATVVNEDKDALEKSNSSEWRKQFDLDSKLAESIFVGIVEEFVGKGRRQQPSPVDVVDTPTGPVRKGTLVTSMRKCATKARIVTLPSDELISLAAYQDLDSGEIATILSSYLPAFGALHHGIELRHREGRFSIGALSNFQVLVSGGNAVEAEAVIKLALLGGASRVYAFQVANLTKINSPKLVVLDGPADDYASRLYQSVDIIVDLGFLNEIDFLKQAVSSRGRLVCVVPRNRSKNLLSRVQEMLGQATLIKHPGTTVYDFDDMCKSEYGEVLRDLRFLLDLAQKRKLRPRVDRYIKARDVEIMQEDMHLHPPRGTVICEPWREFTQEPSHDTNFHERLEQFCAHTLRIEG